MLTKRHFAAGRAAASLLLLALAACATPDEPETVYCYRTLADVSCYLTPDQGRESRLVGTYVRGPEPTAADEPAPDEGGAITRWLGATIDLAGRLISPIGSIAGLVVNP
ncbi:MAG: hypothetical protein U1E52_08290 [Geminicoccaceae bacterium]